MALKISDLGTPLTLHIDLLKLPMIACSIAFPFSFDLGQFGPLPLLQLPFIAVIECVDYLPITNKPSRPKNRSD